MTVKQNYLNFYPSTGIANQLNAENIEDKLAVQKLITDISTFIGTVEQENKRYLQTRKSLQVVSDDSVNFFRNQKRIQNICLILQYLAAFLSRLPLKEEIEGQQVNPFEQLKGFTRFRADLLKTPDVLSSILMEYKRVGVLDDTNVWYYRGQVSKNYKQIIEIVGSAKTAVVEDYCKLFEALQRICLFWFSVKNENIKQVRKSDINIYKLTRILLKRYRPPGSYPG